MKEIATGREISTTKEGTTTTLAGDLIQITTSTTATKGTMTTIILQGEIILVKDTTIITTTPETIIKEGITTTILGTILIITTIQAERTIIIVILILDMKTTSTRDTTTMNTSAPVGTFYTSILIHRQDSTTSLAVLTSSVKFIVRWRRSSVAQRAGRNSITWIFSRTAATCAQDPSRGASDLL